MWVPYSLPPVALPPLEVCFPCDTGFISFGSVDHQRALAILLISFGNPEIGNFKLTLSSTKKKKKKKPNIRKITMKRILNSSQVQKLQKTVL